MSDADDPFSRADQLEAENQRLRDELARPDPPPPRRAKKAPPAPGRPSRPRMHPALGLGVLVLFIAGLVAMGILGATERTLAGRIGDAGDVVPREARARWRALVAVEPCLAHAVVRLHYFLVDPSRDRRLAPCPDELRRAAVEPGLDPAADDALRAFTAASQQLDGSDESLARWRRSLETAREVAVPAVRARIAAAADEREGTAGRDLLWWQIRVGLAYRDLSAAAIDLCRPGEHLPAAPDPANFPSVLGPPLARLEDLATAAPIEVRRRIRGLGERIERIAAQYDRVDGLSTLIDAGDVLLDTTRRD